MLITDLHTSQGNTHVNATHFSDRTAHSSFHDQRTLSPLVYTIDNLRPPEFSYLDSVVLVTSPISMA